MKFLGAMVVYIVISAVLCAGIYQMMMGKPWLLIGSMAAYVLAFAKIGCMSH